MRKLIGLILWLGGPIVAFWILYTMMEGTPVQKDEPLKFILMLVLIGVAWLASGIGRRLFHIKAEDIEDDGLGACIVSRIFCRRLFGSVTQYVGVALFAYALFLFGYELYGWGMVVCGFLGLVITGGGTGILRYTCTHCGERLSFDESDYDNDLVIESSSSSTNAYRYSTDYYHCPRCGHQKRLRVKNLAASINH